MNTIGIDLGLLIPGRIGGAETYVRNLIQSLATLDNLSTYVLFGNRSALDSIETKADNFTLHSIVPANGIRNISFRLIRRLLWDQFDYDLAAAFVGRQKLSVLHEPLGTVRMITDTPVALTILDVQHEFYPHFFSRRELELRKRWYPKSLQRASTVIAISDFTRKTVIERYGIDSEKVVTIHLGHNDSFRPATDREVLGEIAQKYNLPDRFVYYPANSWPHKNHATLLRAMNLLKADNKLDFKLVLSGVIYPEHQNLLASIGELGLVDDVMHLGYPPYRDLPFIYSLATGVVFPSLFEGFGIPVIEAMACGCAVVCSNVTSLPELCGDAAIFVEPTSADDIAHAMYMLVNNSEMSAQMVQRGIERAQLFSWEQTAVKTLRVYRDLANE